MQVCNALAHSHSHTHGADHSEKMLGRAFVLIAGFMFVEVAGGVLANSLTLLADAGHMFLDASALGFSWYAMRLSRREDDHKLSYGYHRFQVLAAFVNGLSLMALCVWILYESFTRLQTPEQMLPIPAFAVASVGFVINLVAFRWLHGTGDNANVRSAALHVLGDLLGSIGAMGAGALILLTGWTPIDAIVSVVIAGLILLGAWRLVKEATGVLLEMAPSHVDMEGVLKDLRSIPDLHDVHDLHVWTLTSGFVALSGHGVLQDPTQHQRVLDEIRGRMEPHGIGHVTFQLEPERLHQIARPE